MSYSVLASPGSTFVGVRDFPAAPATNASTRSLLSTVRRATHFLPCNWRFLPELGPRRSVRLWAFFL